jgi:aspartate beta-hydroxylase
MSSIVNDETRALEAAADAAIRAGRGEEAVRYLSRILEINGSHPGALEALGQHAFRRGDLAAARSFYERLGASGAASCQHWVNLAVVCQGQRDEAGEEKAIKGALAVDPLDLLALILRGNLLERQGRQSEAAHAYGAVAAVSPPLERLHPDLRPAVTKAIEYRDRYQLEVGKFLDEALEPDYKQLSGEDLRRFRDSVDIMVGRKLRFESRSEIYHFPRLPPIEFFDRELFPWLEVVEAATDEIREEFLAVLADEEGFTPYITYPPGVPLNQWVELNNSPAWSAFHLIKMGDVVAENAARCPRTMAALAGVPQPSQPGRTPSAMFSLLKPHTRIPAHTGVTNVRLVTHLPLIVPAGCGFRVGNQTREWVPGKAWVFDDTMEHEAWNDSDQLRVVLIFDTWHPQLTAAERHLVTRLATALNRMQVGGAPGATATPPSFAL